MKSFTLEVKPILSDAQGETLIVREGQAAPIILPQKWQESGTIKTPAAYYAVHKTDTDELKGVSNLKAVVDVTETSITLILDPANEYAPSITGTLLAGNDIKKFKINMQERMTGKDIARLFRFNKRFFSSGSEYDTALAFVSKFSAKKNTNVDAQHDTKGSKRNLVDVQVDVPDCVFSLIIPIYEGEQADTFQVNILADVSNDSDVRFNLESVPLEELAQSRAKEIIQRELSVFNTDGFVVVYKN